MPARSRQKRAPARRQRVHAAAHAAPHVAAPHFAPHVGGGGAPHFTTHVGGGAPHFAARSGGTPHFTRHIVTPHVTNRTATANRSLHVTQPNNVTGRSPMGRRPRSCATASAMSRRNLGASANQPQCRCRRNRIWRRRPTRRPIATCTTTAPPASLRRRRGKAASRRALRRARKRIRHWRSDAHRRAPRLASPPSRRLRRLVRAGVLALRLFRHFRLRVLARRL